MCGIAGIYAPSSPESRVERVEKMIRKLAPRGPDGAGVVGRNRVALGHRRLKIIDLSDNAQQPMVDSDLKLDIVFNGCIYNYKELRSELEASGYRFFSTSDTEVVLKAYHAWGTDCVKHFNGMFAFAVHEWQSGRLILARDRLGIKPLYITESDGQVAFASTLPAILEAGVADTDIDPVALNYYMSFHAVVPAPYTILKGVRKLPPATVRVYEKDGSHRSETYWQLEVGGAAEDRQCDAVEWQERLLAALRLAVRRRMVADVPVGVLLSGGLDSSLIVGLLAEQGQDHLNTFSIGFEDAGGEKGNEFMYSDIVADRFSTDHHKIKVPTQAVLSTLPDTFQAMSEPMVSHDNIGFYLLSQEVSRHLKVVQSGQGADEVFGGYHWYPPLLESDDAAEDYSRLFMDMDYADYARAVTEEYVQSDLARSFVNQRFETSNDTNPVDKALHLDSTVMLIDDPVKRVDNMTMSFGLEARVPFLDHELVELAGRIPAELKVRGDGKWILKEAARSVIPADVIDRPKGYFPVPALKYLQGPYLDMVRDTLDGFRCVNRGIFRREYISELLEQPSQHITPLGGSKLWQVALLELWLEAQGL